jgi:hypothetical protein
MFGPFPTVNEAATSVWEAKKRYLANLQRLSTLPQLIQKIWFE